MLAKNQKAGRGPSRKARKTFWITRKDQLQILASAVRLDILDRLIALGPLSVKQLASSMGRNATPIYHHLEQMEKAGLLRKVYASGTRGRPAAVYQGFGELTRLARAPLQAANRPPMAKIGRIAAGQAAKDYARGFKSKHWQIQGPARNHWFFRCITQPSPRRLAKINQLLNELAELIWTPDPSPGKLSMSVAWFLAPLTGPPLTRSKSSRDPRPRRSAKA